VKFPAHLLLWLIAVSAPVVASSVTPTAPRSVLPFDADWRFHAGEQPGAEQPHFADEGWSNVTLPHDWSIAGPFEPKNPTGGAGAFLPSGVAWYRKTFTLPAAAHGKSVWMEFDGVMQNSDVWINGRHLGHRPYGYVSLRYDLTADANFGPDVANVLAVRTDTAEQPASRWYSGAGIYRHVRLVITDPVHLEPDSVFISTRPDPTPAGVAALRGARHIQVRATAVNTASQPHPVSLHVSVVDPAGSAVGESDLPTQVIAAGQGADFSAELAVDHAQAWDTDAPRLYHATVSVRVDHKAVDAQTIAFGIRDAVFDSNRGFLLNGRPVKLYGVCLHHDGGAFGAAVPLAVWEQRLRTLRTLGVNAIRTAHNPPDPGFLDLCDRMGILVMDELFDCWTVGKNPYDYHLYFDAWSKQDVRDTVRRDRNHPCIVLYSAGNEIHDTPQEEKAKAILSGLVATFHANDPTRAVTQALFRPNVSHDYTNGLADLLDVIGTNYRDQELLAAWRDKPGRKIVGTEQRHDRETWLALRDHPAEAGQFLWTGVDYLGESRRWPVIGNASGLLDRTGLIRPIGRERQSWWSAVPMVALTRRIAPTVVSQYDPGYEPLTAPSRRRQVLFPDWNPSNPQPHDEMVEVYSNAQEVELVLNGQSLGRKSLPPDAEPRVWHVPYRPGTLLAIARNAGQEVARDELRTAGAPAKIVLTANRSTVSSDWEDVLTVTATVVDAHGMVVPTADNTVSFTIDGPGRVVAVDNGNNATHEPFQATRYPAHQGRCVAFVRATDTAGTFTVHAAAEGLSAGEVRVSAH
jgi:beta-galactosidase